MQFQTTAVSKAPQNSSKIASVFCRLSLRQQAISFLSIAYDDSVRTITTSATAPVTLTYHLLKCTEGVAGSAASHSGWPPPFLLPFKAWLFLALFPSPLQPTSSGACRFSPSCYLVRLCLAVLPLGHQARTGHTGASAFAVSSCNQPRFGRKFLRHFRL